jgi:hypothetical protein
MDGLVDWYWLGVALGLGLAAGAGRLGGWAARGVALAALAGGLVIAFFAGSAVWAGPFAGLGLGVVFLRHLSREASLAATLGLGALALVPALGYVEGLAAPLLGRRLTRRVESRYAGLRVLAKD